MRTLENTKLWSMIVTLAPHFLFRGRMIWNETVAELRVLLQEQSRGIPADRRLLPAMLLEGDAPKWLKLSVE